MNPTIVVSTYNRLSSLKRLLASLKNADYQDYSEVRLVISVDKHPTQEAFILDYLNAFEWQYGELKIISHVKRMGLKNHFMFCCDLSLSFGSVIFLEDDFILSPYFYHYATQALSFYEQDERIAGISLYELKINESANRSFTPVLELSDQYFIQLPSWGKVFSKSKWEKFKEWIKLNNLDEYEYTLPTLIRKWPKTSFKREYVKYMIAANKFFVFPRKSFVTNFGDKGEHYSINEDSRAQRPICLGANSTTFSFTAMDQSLAIYDAFMEISPQSVKTGNNSLKDFDFSVDLYGIKPKTYLAQKPYVLTAKRVSNSVKSFGRKLLPHEANILLNVPGSYFSLSKSTDIIGRKKGLKTYCFDNLYDHPGTSIFKLFLIDVVKGIRDGKQILAKKMKIGK